MSAVEPGPLVAADDPAGLFAGAAALVSNALPAPSQPACPRGVFLVAPEGFSRAAESATDNRYMAAAAAFDGERALVQHRGLLRALADCVPAVCFPGDPATPDAVFPNNVFATAPGRYLIGHMRHPVRRAEAERADIRGFFEQVLGYRCIDLRAQPGVAELTGSLVIDRARGIGYAGLSERCDATGAAAMHAGFGLAQTFCFALAAGEWTALGFPRRTVAGAAGRGAPSGVGAHRADLVDVPERLEDEQVHAPFDECPGLLAEVLLGFVHARLRGPAAGGGARSSAPHHCLEAGLTAPVG